MDYYTTLGVEKTATAQEIKKAYKKMAMKHHPDRGGTHEMFNKIREAYDILSDEDARRRYDDQNQRKFRKNGDYNYEFWSFKNHGSGYSINIEEVFNEAFKDEKERRLKLNKNVRLRYKVKLTEVLTGKKLEAKYNLPSGEVKEITVNIPKGVEDGKIITLDGYGDNSIKYSPPGKLHVLVEYEPHPDYEVKDRDVQIELGITMLEALTGCEKIVKTLEGKTLQLHIKKGTQSGSIHKIKGLGLPSEKNKTVGDFLVKINVDIPNLDKDKLDKLKDLLT